MKLLSDSHTDFLTAIPSPLEREKYISSIAKCTNTISCAVFTSEYAFSVQSIHVFADEIINLSKKYNINLIFSIEDLGFIKNQNDLLKLIKLKPFSTTLTWNYANQYAGGTNSNDNLTPLGISTIDLLEQNNILIDTAHLNKQSFNEFIKISKFPIYNSHCNIEDIYSHPRNLDYNQIKKIVDSNGYLGLTIYNKFISNTKISTLDISYQFDYLIKNFGANNFGFGTDLYGFDKAYLPKDIKHFKDLAKISSHLLDMGHKLSNIDKIMHINFANFVKNIEQQT